MEDDATLLDVDGCDIVVVMSGTLTGNHKFITDSQWVMSTFYCFSHLESEKGEMAAALR